VEGISLVGAEAVGTVIIENCTFEGADYGIHLDGGTSNVIVRNCVLAAKNSFAQTLNNVLFVNCYFKDGGNSKFLVGQSGITLTANSSTLLSGKTFKQTVQDSMAGSSYNLTLIENGTTYNMSA